MSDWVRICHTAELLPGEVQTAWDGDTPIAVFNIDGELYAIEDICTHDGGELTGGAIIGHAIAQSAKVVRQHRLAVAEILRQVGLGDVLAEDHQVVDAGGHGLPPIRARWR